MLGFKMSFFERFFVTLSF